MTTWPFTDPPNVAVFTTRAIVAGERWIARVTHDEEDGAWQFHALPGDPCADQGIVVALKRIVTLDPTVAELADLPVGWFACREAPNSPWCYALKDPGEAKID